MQEAHNMKKSKVIFLIGTVFVFFPLVSGAAIIQRHLVGDSTINTDAKSHTGYNISITSFAHTTDVHLVDEGNPLRADELAIMIQKDPLRLFELQKYIELFHDSNHYEDGIYSALIWESVVEAINDENKNSRLDFLISTGDHTDSCIKNELQWFVDILDGVAPADFENHVNKEGLRTIKPNPVGLDIPWYGAIGNHDAEYMGAFNNDGFVTLLIKLLGYEVDPSDIGGLSYAIETYSSSVKALTTSPEGHGFTGIKTNGYYAFDPSPFIHCIVMNTAYYYGAKYGLPMETLAGGVLDLKQFDWVKSEIEKNPDKLCILISHHSPDNFKELNQNVSQNYVSADAMRAALVKYDNVIAHVVGHTHGNTITPVTDGNSGYWQIITASSFTYPQEWRRITVKDNGDGTGTISCRIKGHQPVYTTTYDPRYPVGTDTYYLSLFEEGNMDHRGEDTDRDADLYFKIPDAVAANIKANYVPPTNTATTSENATQSAEAASDSGSSSGGGCFISTAVL